MPAVALCDYCRVNSSRVDNNLEFHLFQNLKRCTGFFHRLPEVVNPFPVVIEKICICRIVVLKVKCLCLAGWTKILPLTPFCLFSQLFYFQWEHSPPPTVYLVKQMAIDALHANYGEARKLTSNRLIYPSTQLAAFWHRQLQEGQDRRLSRGREK